VTKYSFSDRIQGGQI